LVTDRDVICAIDCGEESKKLAARKGEEQVAGFKLAFFAFPNEPAELKNTIEAAVGHANSKGRVAVHPWPQLPVFGASIPDEVKEGIEKADVLVCDITRPNCNVYYEIGYAVGVGKSVAPVVNASWAQAVADIQKDGLFDVIGFGAYENSLGLAGILSDLPSTVLLDLYGKPLNTQQPLFFLNALHKTDFVSGIAAAIKDSQVFYRSFDPAENPRLVITNTISNVTSSAGVIIPLLESYVNDSDRHNLRAAFLAGLSHGLRRQTLLMRYLAPNASQAAVDYRDDVIVARNDSDITEKVTAFCGKVLIAQQFVQVPSARASRSALQRLTLGATAAENEFRTLQGYFVETSEFLRTVRGEVGVVAGRKGSGKTAIFFMVRDNFRKQRDAIIVDLRPESHQLSLFKTELEKILDTGAFDHTIAAFWYFVILTELLLALKRQLEFQARRRSNLLDHLAEINAALAKLEISESGDFTARINRLGKYVTEEVRRLAAKGEVLSQDKLTNVVYRSGIADAKRLFIKCSENFENLVFLFDNIDKGWATDGVDDLDVRLVRLLLEALSKVKSDLGAERRDFISVVFLRNDVFELMVSETPDKGKSSVARIDWTDRVKLKQVIQRRLQASIAEKAKSFDDIWRRFFVATVDGKDSFDYFVDHCLMRPRFLISIIEGAIENAINRGHERVSEDDCVDAVRQHSNSILSDFGYEIQDVSGTSQMILLSLAGSTQYVTKEEVLERFEKADIIGPQSGERLFVFMLWYGVIGVVNKNNVECYIYDFDYNLARLQAEIPSPEDELYALNPALHVALKAKGP
jgi:hypothetical protein